MFSLFSSELPPSIFSFPSSNSFLIFYTFILSIDLDLLLIFGIKLLFSCKKLSSFSLLSLSSFSCLSYRLCQRISSGITFGSLNTWTLETSFGWNETSFISLWARWLSKWALSYYLCSLYTSACLYIRRPRGRRPTEREVERLPLFWAGRDSD